MTRFKNVKRIHEVGVYDPENPTTEPTEWLKLAKYIATVSDESDEETEDEAFYDGDGTPEEVVYSVSAGYAFEGHYDSEIPAQKLIADMKYEVGDKRRLWFRVTTADGRYTFTEVASVTGIKAGDGDASEFEGFEATIKWIRKPKKVEVKNRPVV
ncbi:MULTISPECIES: phage tail tube protein [unclassified Gemella]|uniref:phage tail tube protein n=1 Tax=unclassified Gemella TaxID=2624949 RepID=UPI0015CFC2FA|nr:MULTISPECIES: phage tail protein [unclassified Gemella]MBF0709725.1 phage tail protein [Gemella sp. GL1.1]NYS27069.1 phage tail protein [Gemella sp. GL1]